MKISKYTSYFHDGEILDIKHIGDNIEIYMRSAEIDPNDMKDNLLLGPGNVLKGKLHIQGVKRIKMNENDFFGCVAKLYEDNDLLHLNLKQNIVFLEIGWRGSHPFQHDFSSFEIEAEKIWWENLPD